MKFFTYSILLVSIIFLIVLFLVGISDRYIVSISMGWCISFIYIVSGFILFKKAVKLKNRSFGKMVTFSVFGRLVFAVAAIVFSVKYFELNSTVFLMALIINYFIFQIIEVVGLNKISIKGA